MATVRNRADAGSKAEKSLDDSRFAIVPSDTLLQPVSIDAIYVGVGGNVTMDDGNGGQNVLALAAGGPYFLGGVIRVYATGTTATGLVGVTSKALR